MGFSIELQDLDFPLGIANLDALRENQLVVPNEGSTLEERELLAKWERSNHLSLIAIR